jgi:hypothetical protein
MRKASTMTMLASMAAQAIRSKMLMPMFLRGEKKVCSRKFGPGNAKTYGPNGTRKGARNFAGTVRRFAQQGLDEFGNAKG